MDSQTIPTITSTTTHGPAAVGTSGRMPQGPQAPLPEATYDLAWRYGRDLARLHLVDPEKLYFFWEVTDGTARRGLGREGKLAARLLHVEGGREQVVALAEGVFAVMSWYWTTEPGSRYQGQVGWLSNGVFEPWLASNVIDTPRLHPTMTAEVVWRAGGRKRGGLSPAARGAPLLGGTDEYPSDRPRDAASAAGARRREAAREIVRQPWSGTVRAWSRTAIPPSSDRPAGPASESNP